MQDLRSVYFKFQRYLASFYMFFFYLYFLKLLYSSVNNKKTPHYSVSDIHPHCLPLVLFLSALGNYL